MSGNPSSNSEGGVFRSRGPGAAKVEGVVWGAIVNQQQKVAGDERDETMLFNPTDRLSSGKTLLTMQSYAVLAEC